MKGKGLKIDRNKTVKLIALDSTYKRTGRPLIVGTVYDEDTRKHITGYDLLDDSIKATVDDEALKSISDESIIAIRDGYALDLRNDNDFIIYLMCYVSPLIAKSKYEIIPSKHVYYIFDIEEESVIENDKYNTIEEALVYTKDMNDVQIKDLGAYLGLNPQKQSLAVIRANVRRTVLEEPKKILDFKNKPNPEKTLFVSKLILYDILEHLSDGFFYKGTFVALTKAEVETVLFRESNAALLARVTRALEVVENPTSRSGDEYIKSEVDSRVGEEIKKEKEKRQLAEMKLKYIELTGKRYEGDEDITVLNDEIKRIEAVEKEISKFVESFKGKDLSSLKKSAKMRGMDEELIHSIDKEDALMDAIIDFIRNK